VFAHDRKDGGEAEAGALFFGGKERLEDFPEVFLRDAGAVVLNLYLHVGAGWQGWNFAFSHDDIGRAQGYAARAWGRHGLHGVDDEVLENLEDLAAINFYRGSSVFHLDGYNGGAAGGCDAHGILKNLGRGDDLLGGVGRRSF
jgi:hypothetical protein